MLQEDHQKKLTLALLFTRGVSLKRWDEVGNLSREIALYNALAPQMKRIYFFTYGDKGDISYQDVLAENIVVVPKRLPIPNLLYMLVMPLLLRRQFQEADIYKTNQMKGALAALIAKHLYSKKLIVRCGYEWLQASVRRGTSAWKLSMIRWIERRVYASADVIVLTASHMHTFISREFGISSSDSRVQIISNYIDTELFRPLNIEPEPRSVCFVGRLCEQKNLFHLIKACAQVKAHLHIYGEGPLESNLRKCAISLGAHVSFHGRIANEELPVAMQQCEVFALPSLYEGNPKTLLEAMACGMAVLGTDVEGIEGVIDHNKNGFLCQIDTESIVQALSALMGDVAVRKVLGYKAHQMILNEASLSAVTQCEVLNYRAFVR